MKRIIVYLIVLLGCIATHTFAQNKAILPLLNAYDFLYFNRTNDNYKDSSTRSALLTEAEKTAAAVMNDSSLKKSYPQLYSRYAAEQYYLATLVYLDKYKNYPYTYLLPVLDTAINWYSNNTYVQADSAAINKLKAAAGIRAASVTFSNTDLYYGLINRYNTILLDAMQQQLNEYNTTQQYNASLIDTLFRLYKFRNGDQQEAYSRDYLFQSVLAVYTYLRVIEEAAAPHCDSLLYYYTMHKALQRMAPASVADIPALPDTIANCNQDSLYRADLEDEVYGRFQPPVRGGSMPQGMTAFPWPPPEPSSRSLPLQLKAANLHTLEDANQQLVKALSKAHYDHFDYFYVPDGFALVTPLEQIQTDGTPKGDPPRWNVKVRLSEDFSFMNYLKALFMGEKGYYRVMVFIITDQPFSYTQSIDASTIQNLEGGTNGLPAELGAEPFTPNHKCTVLIYEFEKQKSGDATLFVKPGRYSVQTHLKKTLVWQNLFE